MKTSVGLLIAFVFLACAGCGSGGKGTSTTNNSTGTNTNANTSTNNNGSSSNPVATQIGNRLCGICLGPYLHGSPDNGDSVNLADLTLLVDYVGKNFKACRTYTCRSGMEPFAELARNKYRLYTAVGCWLSRDLTANERELEALIAVCRSGYANVAIVGSEVLLRGDLTESQLLAYMDRVRSATTLGIRITTADSWGTLKDHPNIIAACDEVWANIYPFWEGVAISGAMDRFRSDYAQLKEKVNGKKIVISETGWPSAGNAQGQAVPNEANLARHLNEFVRWAAAENVEYYWFSAFDEPWKQSEPGGVGSHWGLWGTDYKLKNGCSAAFSGISPTPPVASTNNNTGDPSPSTPTDIPISNNFPYTRIADVPEIVNTLGLLIGQHQRNVVTPGGSEYSPGFSSAQQDQFEQSGHLQRIVDQVKAGPTFKAAIPVIRTLTKEKQSAIISAYRRPNYPTWAMNGHIGDDGTTNAGYNVECQIANALADLVESAL